MDILRKYAESTELIPPLQENVCWIVNAVGDVTSRRMGVVDGDVTEQIVSATSADCVSGKFGAALAYPVEQEFLSEKLMFSNKIFNCRIDQKELNFVLKD